MADACTPDLSPALLLAVNLPVHVCLSSALLLMVGPNCGGLAASNPGLARYITGAIGLPFQLMVIMVRCACCAVPAAPPGLHVSIGTPAAASKAGVSLCLPQACLLIATRAGLCSMGGLFSIAHQTHRVVQRFSSTLLCTLACWLPCRCVVRSSSPAPRRW